MGQNFDQAKRDDTFWPMPNILKVHMYNKYFSFDLKCPILRTKNEKGVENVVDMMFTMICLDFDVVFQNKCNLV